MEESNLPALTSDGQLEIVGQNDLVQDALATGGDRPVPWKVIGAKGVFTNGAETVETLDNIIVLALINQRTFWPEEQEQEPKPLCNSPDSVVGFPRDTYDFAEFYPDATTSQGQRTEALSCETCTASDWRRQQGPGGKDLPPLCGEGFRMVFLRGDEIGEITFGGSSIKPTKEYFGPHFSAKGLNWFAFETTVSLDERNRGSVFYAVPVYSKGEPVLVDEQYGYVEPAKHWFEYYTKFRPRQFAANAELEVV